MRRFGLALTRDERFVLDDATANRLVDKLIRQTSVAAIGEDRVSYTGRTRAFARFIQLYRRYVRRMALEDIDGNWVDGLGDRARRPRRGQRRSRAAAGTTRGAAAGRARRIFTPRGRRSAGYPVDAVYERLDRARERLALHLCAGVENERESAWRGAPYLRVIK